MSQSVDPNQPPKKNPWTSLWQRFRRPAVSTAPASMSEEKLSAETNSSDARWQALDSQLASLSHQLEAHAQSLRSLDGKIDVLHQDSRQWESILPNLRQLENQVQRTEESTARSLQASNNQIGQAYTSIRNLRTLLIAIGIGLAAGMFVLAMIGISLWIRTLGFKEIASDWPRLSSQVAAMHQLAEQATKQQEAAVEIADHSRSSLQSMRTLIEKMQSSHDDWNREEEARSEVMTQLVEQVSKNIGIDTSDAAMSLRNLVERINQEQEKNRQASNAMQMSIDQLGEAMIPLLKKQQEDLQAVNKLREQVAESNIQIVSALEQLQRVQQTVAQAVQSRVLPVPRWHWQQEFPLNLDELTKVDSNELPTAVPESMKAWLWKGRPLAEDYSKYRITDAQVRGIPGSGVLTDAVGRLWILIPNTSEDVDAIPFNARLVLTLEP